MTPPNPTTPARKEGGEPSLFRKISMGAGHLPGYGDHPGTGTVVFLTLITGLAGAQHGGWSGLAVGCGLGAVVYGPLWLCGCVGRANDYLRARALSPVRLQEED